ncbi:rCG21273, isoform CRA_a [Rattus norvegicus]|uniref:RCG21273, isoform CRA_a n=1 Tax=Rattus norvegicus TaxID=10116 RepID=A6J055_RAT|nr:rCG21273, isoform CRA_a [Rattus norvegicus]
MRMTTQVAQQGTVAEKGLGSTKPPNLPISSRGAGTCTGAAKGHRDESAPLKDHLHHF